MAFFSTSPGSISSINTYAYSPHPLMTYLPIVFSLLTSPTSNPSHCHKPVIISITGSPRSTEDMLNVISLWVDTLPPEKQDFVAIEFNASCPNIDNKPPMVFDPDQFGQYLELFRSLHPKLKIGIKLPPLSHHSQFVSIINSLSGFSSPSNEPPIRFLTLTNTLGNCSIPSSTIVRRYFSPYSSPSQPPPQIGGMGGNAIHFISIGNVKTWRDLIDKQGWKDKISIIGVGGVIDRDSAKRLKDAGADCVAVGTGLGWEGVKVFEKIASMAGSNDDRDTQVL
jgi:dihydroorotate dehydrogenase (fumarate)